MRTFRILGCVPYGSFQASEDIMNSEISYGEVSSINSKKN